MTGLESINNVMSTSNTTQSQRSQTDRKLAEGNAREQAGVALWRWN